jgi:IS66 C-terminal element
MHHFAHRNCKLNGVNAQAYVAYVLTKLVNLWPASRIDQLMPVDLGGRVREQARGMISSRRRASRRPLTMKR